MGTNYYALKKKPKIKIIRQYEGIHIGKSSMGWKFLFHDNENFHNFEEFKDWLEKSKKDYVIKDEYGREVSVKELLELIAVKQKENNPDDFKYNKNVNGYRFVEGDFS